MSTYSRAGLRWSVNEILSLQREFELLGLSIDEISSKHNRSPDAIMYKLSEEGFADYNVLYSNYHNLNSPIPDKVNQIELDSYSDDEDNASEYCEDNDEDYVDGGDDESDESDDDNDDDEVTNLSERVDGLEDSISEIKSMLKQMMSSFSSNQSSSKSSLKY